MCAEEVHNKPADESCATSREREKSRKQRRLKLSGPIRAKDPPPRDVADEEEKARWAFRGRPCGFLYLIFQ
jgi:hypothetical protein